MNVLMPQLGETVAEGTVANWHKKVGDTVAADEILLDVETDKVSMEIPAPGPGVITQILVQAGTTVEVGTVLAVIESSASASTSAPQPAAPAAPAKAPEVAATPAQPAPQPAAQPVAAAAPAAASHGGAVQRSDQMRLSPAVRRLAA